MGTGGPPLGFSLKVPLEASKVRLRVAPHPYRAPQAMSGRYGQLGGHSIPQHPNIAYSNVVKQYANLNACYSCRFDVADGHTSMLCPPHLRKATHHIGFNCNNAQQYINLGHPCSTKNRHKIQFPTNRLWLGATSVVDSNNINSFYVNRLHSLYPTQLCMTTEQPF